MQLHNNKITLNFNVLIHLLRLLSLQKCINKLGKKKRDGMHESSFFIAEAIKGWGIKKKNKIKKSQNIYIYNKAK
jgi:hypothetical protein